MVSLEPTTFEEVMNTITQVGEVCGRLERAQQLVAELLAMHAQTMTLVAQKLDAGAVRPTVAFLEWTDPLFTGGMRCPWL